MLADAQLKSPAPAKFSRYRSVRKATSAQPITTEPVPTLPLSGPGSGSAPAPDNGTVIRSMSRYRKPRAPVAQTAVPAVPTMPTSQEVPRGRSVVPVKRDTALVASTNPQRERREQERLQRMQAEEEQERLLREQQRAKEIVEEQKRKDLERLQASLEAAAPVTEKPASKLNPFGRKRSPTVTKTSPPPMPRLDGPPVPELRPAVTDVVVAQVGPGVDAPKSAVNAGERRVLIRCKQSSITLPITPETTPENLIYTAANIMVQDIDPKTAILVEAYNKLGLERPIRRYEHVRDVLNSWDRDTQNGLIISQTDEASPWLDADGAPKKQPEDVTVYLYHSQRPGRWNKRYITLSSTGQIYSAKKPDAKSTDKDYTPLCHMSDFDIYMPTAQEIRKSLRPPKKTCYAIKSQQKTNVFMSTENFVHFFCTDRDEVASTWYNACQQWRSWYLINKMGEGTKQSRSASRPRAAKQTHGYKISVDENPYTIGTFKPLLDMERFNSLSGSGTEDEIVTSPENSTPPVRKRRPREKQPPPTSYPDVQLPASGYNILASEPTTAFSPSGLLGNTYAERQKAQKEREAAEQSADPFAASSLLAMRPQTSGDGQHQSSSLSRATSVRTTHNRRRSVEDPPLPTNGLMRSGSKRVQQKPLLDLTPEFVEAPQWSSKNRGHGVTGMPGATLVESATSVPSAIPGLPDAPLQRSGTTRRPTTSSAHERERAIKAEWERLKNADDSQFVKGSLLERIGGNEHVVIADRSKGREIDVRVGEGV